MRDTVESRWRQDVAKRVSEYVSWMYAECHDELKPMAANYLDRAAETRLDLEASWRLYEKFDREGRTEDKIVFYKMFNPKEMEKEIERLNSKARYFMNPKPKNDGTRVTPVEIETARQFPMTSLVNKKKGQYIKCILHEDKKPSMLVNDYYLYCFVCAKGVDSIEYVQMTEHICFMDAVKRLSR